MINTNHTGQLQPAIKEVGKILPVLGVENVGSSTQERASNARNFLVGHVYQAKVLEKVGQFDLVKVDNQVLKMQLGDSGKLGATLALKFLQANPTPTFSLNQAHTFGQEAKTHLSQTGQLIGKLLQQAQAQGVTARYQADGVVTNNPMFVAQFANDLKQAIRQSGLFYESHLQALSEGDGVLESLKQEPHNAQRQPLTTIVSQQLSLLDTQKFAWSGEVWAGQQMQLDVVPNVTRNTEDENAEEEGTGEDAPIQSTLALSLPKLGDVKAVINLRDGKLQVQLLAKEKATRESMQLKRQALNHALSANGQSVESLTVDMLTTESISKENESIRQVTPG